MKADQRKELETNTLADRMGHVMQRVQTSQRRTVVLYGVAVVVVIFLLWFGYRWWDDQKQGTSLQWLTLYDGAPRGLDELSKDRTSAAGKAARLQIAWIAYWDLGVKSAAADKLGSLSALKEAQRLYGELVEDCKDDKNPVFMQQAMLGLAVTQESLAVENPASLKKASENYKELVEKFPKSAEAKFARDRLEILDDETKRKSLENSYESLRRLFRDPGFQMPFDDLHKKFGIEKK